MVNFAIAIAGPRSTAVFWCLHVPLLCYCMRVTIAIAIAIVGSRSGCSCCWGVPVALGGKDVMATKMLIADVLTLLLLIEYS